MHGQGKTRWEDPHSYHKKEAESNSSQKLQSIAASQSSLLNKAYYTLLSPVQRAQYLLAQHGQAMAETEQLQNQALIMEVMDAREELEEASSEEEIELVQKANKSEWFFDAF